MDQETLNSDPRDEETPVEKPPKRGLLRNWFNRETRFGRLNRTVTRWVAIVVVLFAAGLLTGYFVLVKPIQDEIAGLQTDLSNANLQLASANGSLDSKTRAYNDVSQQFTAINQAIKEANQHIELLQLIGKVQAGRVELANNAFAESRKNLLVARTALQQFAPVFQAYEKDLDKTLISRLDLALAEMEKDPKTATADLNILSTYLLDLEDKLFTMP